MEHPIVRRAHRLVLLAAISALGGMSGGCVVFSTYQDARLTPVGDIQFTPMAGQTNYLSRGTSNDYSTRHLGLAVERGVSPQMALRFRYEFMDYADNYINNSHYISLGPKFGSPEGHVAMDLPVAFYTGKDYRESESFHIQPTIIFTQPLAPQVDVNLAARVAYFFDRDTDPYLGASLGLGFRDDNSSFVFRPEVSWITFPNDDQHYLHLGAACSFTPKGKKP